MQCRLLTLALVVLGPLAACGSDDDDASVSATVPTQASCQQLSSAPASIWPNATTVVSAAAFNPAAAASGSSPALPEHCELTGYINKRVGTDGQSYQIKFHLRMPTAWNGRFFMEGGGGTNGTLSAGVGALGGAQTNNALAQSFATISTDSGHDNAVDNNPNAQGPASFGADYQARLDFGYNSYDQVTQFGKAAVAKYYGKGPDKSYFVGCSEGGREAMMMSQRFPTYYDGIAAGDPGMQVPKSGIGGAWMSQTFAAIAPNVDANGIPAIANAFTDPDLQLLRTAVLGKCDALDGLTDGIVDNPTACQAAFDPATATNPATQQPLQCAGAKTDACLSAAQITALKRAFGGPKNSAGTALYASYPWDAGVGGIAGTTYNQGWRSWWLGTYGATVSNGTRYTGFSAQSWLADYDTPPELIPASPGSSAIGTRLLAFNFDTDAPKIFSSTQAYPLSAMQWDATTATDLSTFKGRGGKLILYHGLSDAAFSANDTIAWYTAMGTAMGGTPQNFSRLFLVPGMNHCTGGPATDSFDVLTPLVNWVEKGTAPDSLPASASTPSYFSVTARTRPLCAYPKTTHYAGTGDVNSAANFSCQ
ncbi:MAG TPA: tannase/feruloyl esterase family alpha/beta hydrolase [Burkholderiaceae bacterium]